MTRKRQRLVDRLDRRNYLTAVGGALAAGLAGCAGGGGGDGDGGEGDGSSGDGDGGDGSGNGDSGDGGDGGDDGGNGGDGGSMDAVDELTFLTWNISFLEQSINGWIEDFKSSGYEDTKVNWIDKPGVDLPTYLQTQIQAGQQPQAVDTQGAVYSRYANDGVFVPLEQFASDEFMGKFGEKSLEFSRLEGNLFRFPFYQQTNTTYYRTKWFDEAGVTPPSVSEPYTTDEYFDNATAVVDNSDAEFGLTMHRFDYMFWPFFWSEGVDVLNEDDSAPAFNTDRAVEILGRFRDLTDDGVIPELTWTQRWEPQNQQFGAGNTAMFMSQQAALRPVKNFGSDWVTGETVGIAHAPKNTGYYSAHGWSITEPGISDAEKQAAFDLVRIILSDEWQEDFLRKTTVMAGNLDPQRKLAEDEEFRSNNPLLTQLFELWFEVEDQLVMPPRIPASGEIQAILDSEIGAAALGEKSPERALEDAERQVTEAM